MTTQQTDALQCAADLEYSISHHGKQDAFTLNAYSAMKMVRAQHDRIAELEAQQPAQSSAAADTVVLEAALRAIHQAIDLIGEPDTERLRTVRRVLRGAVVVADDCKAPQADSQPAPVRGKLLPCPCCGGEAAEHDRFNSNTVRCLSCGLRVRQSEIGMGDAAKRWNFRAARAQADSVQEPATVPRFNCWSTNEGDSWFDHPADSQAIYDCLGNDAKVGDEYELTAGWKSVTARYRITEVVGDGEEYEVECISHPHENSAPQPPTAQAAESVPAPVPPPECETEAEKRAFAFGWFKALESERMKADSVLEDAARWRAWAVGMVEACAAPHDVTPPFMAAFEEAIGDSEACFSVEQLNGWVDAARKQGATQ